MKTTPYAIGLIYNDTGTRIGLFEFADSLWPCLVDMRKDVYLAKRFKETTEKLFEQKIEWENVKPLELNLPMLEGYCSFQLFRTFEPGLIYACSSIMRITDYTNKHFAKLVVECSDRDKLPYKNVAI